MLVLATLLILLIAGAIAWQASPGSPKAEENMATQITSLQVTSPAFHDGARIPAKYTADGDDLSPPLSWQQVSGVREFALICDDPDAPGGTFTHWVMYGIPSGYTGLPAGVTQDPELDDGSMQGKNSFGKIGYGGPSPPAGKPHRYIFTVYALDVKMDLPSGITRDKLLAAIKGHVIAEGSLTGLYGR